jgi:uncharacterized protein (TIGR02452 family)
MNVAHFILQWAVNSTASRQFRWPNSTTEKSSCWDTDYVIYSPDVPVFRNDAGELLEESWPLGPDIAGCSRQRTGTLRASASF